MHARPFPFFLALILLSAPLSAYGIGSSMLDAPEALLEAEAMIEDEDFEDAIELLEELVDMEPRNADGWNLLGFSYRKTGELDEAFAAYNKALLIDPTHPGANEYLGELYLQTGDIAAAEDQLRLLEQTCPDPCEEAEILRNSIAAAKEGS